jgi:hypothetical protein
MDLNIVRGLNAKAHLAITRFEHRDLDHGIGAVGAANHDDLLAFPRQYKHWLNLHIHEERATK